MYNYEAFLIGVVMLLDPVDGVRTAILHGTSGLEVIDRMYRPVHLRYICIHI